MSLRGRLAKLERAQLGYSDGPCPWPGITVDLEPGEPAPADAATCPLCHQPHVGVVIEAVVEPVEGRGPP
jgi:hypothetical protein